MERANAVYVQRLRYLMAEFQNMRTVVLAYGTYNMAWRQWGELLGILV